MLLIEILRFSGPDGAGPWWEPAARVEAADREDAANQFARQRDIPFVVWRLRPSVFDCGRDVCRVSRVAPAQANG